MVLLINTFITNKSGTGGAWETAGVSQDRGNLTQDNKLDILKYTLSSFAKAYPWKRVIIKAQLDDEYTSEEIKKEFEHYVREEFKDFDLYFSHTRNVTQQDWIETHKLINDDYVHCYCSHDHVLMDYSPEYLERILNSLREDNSHDYVTLSLSHWSEFMRNAKAGPTNTHRDVAPMFYNINYKLEENYVSYEGFCYDSIHIISEKLYKDWFCIGEWDKTLLIYPPNTFKTGHIELPRIDGVGITDLNFIRNKLLNIPTPRQKIVIPYREIARHYDGYFYHGITNNQAPSLDIPKGFFEKDIKIRYGYDTRKEGWVNINPKNEYYYASNKSGADYKFTLEEIPLFWKSRISQWDINPDINEEEMIQYRLKSVLEMLYTSENHNPYIEPELETKVLNEYLKIFPQFNLI